MRKAKRLKSKEVSSSDISQPVLPTNSATLTETPRRRSLIPSFPTVTSIIAILISIGTFYFTHLAPFELGLTLGPVVWQPYDSEGRFPQLGAARDRTFQQMTMLVPVTFTHRGARPGVIEDIVVTLRDVATGRTALRFDPELEVDESVFMTDFAPAAHTRWIRARFRPISLAKGQQVDKFFLFLPHVVDGGDQPLAARGETVN